MMINVWLAAVLSAMVATAPNATIEGELKVWHPVTITFHGPEADATDKANNPFLDVRLQVCFTGPPR